jgi:hypothetical protein
MTLQGNNPRFYSLIAAIREALKDNEDAVSSRFVPESMNIITEGMPNSPEIVLK